MPRRSRPSPTRARPRSNQRRRSEYATPSRSGPELTPGAAFLFTCAFCAVPRRQHLSFATGSHEWRRPLQRLQARARLPRMPPSQHHLPSMCTLYRKGPSPAERGNQATGEVGLPTWGEGPRPPAVLNELQKALRPRHLVLLVPCWARC